ncbi:hypothetical protein GBAR_LOCUS10676 [Geodia barretti]|nr:hypothetical protein GBAR_LOCUS10676 [Geodia barretti]
MDRFIPQFYTLVCQLLQSLSGSSSSRWSHDESGDPLISEWLQADLNADQLLSYFPSHLRKSLVSHSHSTGGGRRRGKSSEGVFKSVSISELLAHFKSYVRRHEAEACERKLLAGKTKLLESLTERNAHLEEQVLGMRRTEIPDSHQLTNGHPPHHQNGTTGHSTTLEKGEGEEEARLKKMLRKSNARVEELLATNNQWAIEAGERASKVAILQIELQDAQKDNQSLRKTRHTTAPSVVGGAGGITRSEFTSNGDVVETNSRTEQEKQLKQERDAAVRENERLKAELVEERSGREEDRDEIEELRDRVANLRVQATSKMPTVKELTALSSENRQLREKAERDKAQIEALVQKLETLQNKLQMQHSSNLSSCEGSLLNEAATNQSGVLVESLAKEDDLNGVGNSHCYHDNRQGQGRKQAPIFIDDTPMAQKKPPFPWDTQAAATTHTMEL